MRRMPIMQTLGPNFFNLPAAAIVLGGLVNPVTQAFYLSFFDWKIGTSFEDAPYVGFRHFLRMVYDADVHESIWVTLKFGFWTILIEMVLGNACSPAGETDPGSISVASTARKRASRPGKSTRANE